MQEIEVVHIVAKLDRGGVEVWLKELFECHKKLGVRTSFIATKNSEGYFDKDLISKGAKIFRIDSSNNILFLVRLYFFFKKHKFQVVHSHLLNFSGLIMFVAWLANIPIRVSHSHSDKSLINFKANLIRKAYLKITQVLLKRFATKRLACSNLAGRSLYGNYSFKVIENGINVEKFNDKNVNLRAKYLKEFGIKEEDRVIGHVGRFSIPKNHDFIVDIIQRLTQRINNFKIILVGSGELEDNIKDKVFRLGLTKYFVFAGGRDDVPDLMTNLFDIFLFPSLYEGMPISLIETQVAGLPSIISSSIPRDVIKIESLFKIISLKESAETWAEAIEEVLTYTPINNRFHKLNSKSIIETSDLNISVSANKLLNIYKGA
ncbi:glycosyltransferase [Sphingobacterium thermophilum]|uniref:Glycosyltransferase family 1 protein n=1 Tax=Sphingobacterium thermophilum TaxID=768534 RepID=A0ABP8R098_9SPHI